MARIGIIVTGENILADITLPNPDSIQPSYAYNLFKDLLEEFLIQFDIRFAFEQRDKELYFSCLLARFTCKLLWVFAVNASFWPSLSKDTYKRIKKDLPEDIRYIMQRAIQVKNSLDRGLILSALPELLLGAKNTVIHLAESFAIEQRKDGIVLEHVDIIANSMQAHSELGWKNNLDVEYRRQKIAAELLSSRKEHYDFNKWIYGIINDV